jgi:hypothetical protein
MEWNHIRSVGEGVVGIRMDFHEEPVYAGAGCRTGQRLDKFALPALLRAAASR